MNWLIILLGTLCVGCIPMRATVREAKGGEIVDGRTGTPVAGATVRVESFRVSTPPGYGGGYHLVDSLEVTTDMSGRWSVPDRHEWTIGILAADGLPLYANIYCVFAAGYVSQFRNPHSRWFGRQPSTTAGASKDRDMDALLALEHQDPAHPDQSDSSPPTARSCLQKPAVQPAVAADGAAPRR
jgi:hypothetical protein